MSSNLAGRTIIPIGLEPRTLSLRVHLIGAVGARAAQGIVGGIDQGAVGIGLVREPRDADADRNEQRIAAIGLKGMGGDFFTQPLSKFFGIIHPGIGQHDGDQIAA